MQTIETSEMPVHLKVAYLRVYIRVLKRRLSELSALAFPPASALLDP